MTLQYEENTYSPYNTPETRATMFRLGQDLLNAFPSIHAYLQTLTEEILFAGLYKYNLDTTFDQWMRNKEAAELSAYAWRKQVKDLHHESGRSREILDRIKHKPALRDALNLTLTNLNEQDQAQIANFLKSIKGDMPETQGTTELSETFNFGLDNLEALTNEQITALLDVVLYFAIGSRPIHKISNLPRSVDPESAFAVASSLQWLVTLLGTDEEYTKLDAHLMDYYKRAQPPMAPFSFNGIYNVMYWSGYQGNEEGVFQEIFGYEPTRRTGSRYRSDYHPAVSRTLTMPVEDEWFFTRSMPIDMARSMQTLLADLFGIKAGEDGRMEYFCTNLQQSLLNPGFYRIVMHRADIRLAIKKLKLSEKEKSILRTVNYHPETGLYSALNTWGEEATPKFRQTIDDCAKSMEPTNELPSSSGASTILMTRNVSDKKTKNPDDPVNQAKAKLETCQNSLRSKLAHHIIKLIQSHLDNKAIQRACLQSFCLPFSTGPYLLEQLQRTDITVMTYTLEKLANHELLTTLYENIMYIVHHEETTVVTDAKSEIPTEQRALAAAKENLINTIKAASNGVLFNANANLATRVVSDATEVKDPLPPPTAADWDNLATSFLRRTDTPASADDPNDDNTSIVSGK